MLRKILLPLVLIQIPLAIFSQKQTSDYSLESIWQRFEFTVRTAGGINYMPDGNFYTDEGIDAKGQSCIIKYETATGNAIDTLLRSSNLIPEDSTKAIRINGYELSPDGSKILISTQTESIYRHSTMERNFVYFIKSKKLMALSRLGKQRYAQFSPDGNKIAYIINNNLYINDLVADETFEYAITKDGEKNRIIYGATDWVYEEEFSINRAFFWSPDSKSLAFYRFDESQVKEYTLSIYRNSYPDLETYKYPKAGEDNSKVSIWVYDLESQKSTRMNVVGDNEDCYIARVKWTKDPSQLAIEKLNRHQNKLDLLLTDIHSGAYKTVLTETDDAYIDITDDLYFTNDKQHFVWTSERSGTNLIYYYDLNGQLIKTINGINDHEEITKFYGLDENTGRFYFQSTYEKPYTRTIAYRELNSPNLAIYNIQSAITGSTDLDFSPDFKYATLSSSSINRLPQFQLVDNNFKSLRMLEDNSDLAERMKKYNFSKIEFFSFRTEDSTLLYGWMVKPWGKMKKKKTPVFMTCYGGPGSQEVTDSWNGMDYFTHQYLASKGYMVVCVDNRGTGARGAKFKKCTYLRLGELETQDQISAAKWIGNLPMVDNNRIGMFGWSYGGFMATNCILKGADVFKCAVAVAPVTDWRFYDNIYTERYMRTPKENKAGYDATSCLKMTDQFKGKFLLMHGTADDNVHLQNSIELSNALLKSNKQFEQFFYPNKNHGIYGGNTRLNLYTRLTNFIFTNL